MFAVRPVLDAAGENVAVGDWASALAAARRRAPYLDRSAERAPDAAAAIAAGAAAQVAAEAIAQAHAAGGLPLVDAMTALRRAKRAMHLAVAIGDLAGVWPLEQVTGELSAFADAALGAAERVAAHALVASRELADAPSGSEGVPGLILIAMGKHGAFELNYSSDIDVSVFFDPQRLPVAPGREAQRAAVRMAQMIVRVLEEITADGYVLRMDLRLRPDPGATPIAVAAPAALNYYQSLGQSWERAAFLKARPAAGDKAAAAAFLEELAPFRWRKHLDYAAIADILAIKRQIRAHKDKSELTDPGFDAKLGRGTIRDVEFFAQTQQLILGGRNPGLRAAGTLEALNRLVEHGHLAAGDRDALAHAYRQFRAVEHRAQMLEDRQTHAVPSDTVARASLAALCGHGNLSAFDRGLSGLRIAVAGIDESLFVDTARPPRLSLYDFNGVDDDPDTVERLAALGFANPGRVSETIRAWQAGRVRAMRSPRARELLVQLTPALLEALAACGEADLAFERFADFFARLPAGVQTLSLFLAHPGLLKELSEMLALAPGLAAALARQPDLIDAMLDPRFVQPLEADQPGARRASLNRAAAQAGGFEGVLNVARRLRREEAFRIDRSTLKGRLAPEIAGAAHADLAEACIGVLAEAAAAETARRHGPAPGPFTVLGLGKLGGRELAQGSDLDLMVVYDAADGAGPGAGEYFARLTQRLITALSAPTEEGLLYEVDLQLRPSGSKGPVAVRRSSFERYYAEEAWTWELLALTRARAVGGAGAFGAEIEALARTLLGRGRAPDKIRADAAAMRARMDRDRPGRAPWDLKLAPGGLVDIEFIAQTLQVIAAAAGADAIRPNTADALAALAAAGALQPPDAQRLDEAWRLSSRLQHWLRIVTDGDAAQALAEHPRLGERLAAIGGAPDLAALETRVLDAQQAVRAAFVRLVGPLSDGSTPITR
jgi:glutamate-ammonia-ligase adenylyltransferase